MPETPSDLPEGPDVGAIRHLVRLMKKYDLTALDFIEGTTTIKLRRRGPEVLGVPAATVASPVAIAPAPVAAPAPAAPVAAPQAAPAAPAVGSVIESPMVGTFYSSMSPDVPAFVTVGAKVRPDTIVCIIEAMKVFTDIPATVSGTITEILVKNGQPVEFGQPLFRVSPT